MQTASEIKQALEALANDWDKALQREYKVDGKYKHVKAEELRALIAKIQD